MKRTTKKPTRTEAAWAQLIRDGKLATIEPTAAFERFLRGLIRKNVLRTWSWVVGEHHLFTVKNDDGEPLLVVGDRWDAFVRGELK